MSGPDLRAVMFDFGGTLFSYTAFRRENAGLVAEAAARLGVAADWPTVARAYRAASAEAFGSFYERTYYLHRDLFHETFRGFAVRLGVEPARSFLDWFHAAQRDLVLERFRLRKGCLETLERLRSGGLHVSIVSNIDDDYLEPMLERAGLGAYLDAWTSSEAAGSCKPDAAIFEHALRKAGTSPPETLFVGDSPEHDILGARARGMYSVLLREEGSETASAPGTPPRAADACEASEPHHVIRELPDLLDLPGLPDGG